MIVRVYHESYDCETGCCGHVVEIDNDVSRFEFVHPYGVDVKEWARGFAEGVIRRCWPECLASIDWDSLKIEARDC